MRLFKKNDKVEGSIGFFGLQDWWLNEFTDEERTNILSIYQPLGSDSETLIKGKSHTTRSVVALLGSLAGWFKKPEHRLIGYKILKKAEELVSIKIPVLDRHFLYQVKIELYYRNRDNDSYALEKAIEACQQQIALSEEAKMAFQKEYGQQLPSHVGYKQLCIIMEKHGQFDEAIVLAKTAKIQGWNEDWDKRIDKLRKKINM